MIHSPTERFLSGAKRICFRDKFYERTDDDFECIPKDEDYLPKKLECNRFLIQYEKFVEEGKKC